MRHRVIYLFYLSVSCFLIASSCRQEDYVRNYPQVLSINLISNTEAGITVEGTMSETHRDEVIDHGFIWSRDLKDLVLPPQNDLDVLTPYNSYAVHLGKAEDNVFSADIQSQLVKDYKYFVRAFLKTNETTIYGEYITFVSLGSMGATIASVSPMTILPGDVVTITGERFGTDPTQVSVWLNLQTRNFPHFAIRTIKDKEITAVAPKAFFESVRIVLQKNGDAAPAYSEIVHGKVPTLTSISATTLCDPLQVNGTDLLFPGIPTSVKVNGKTVTPLPVVTNTSITLPPSLHSAKATIQVLYGDVYSFSADLIDPTPMPTMTTTPGSFPPTHTFVVQGTNFPTCGGLEIQATPSDVLLGITETTPTQFKVTMSGNYCVPFTFKLSYRGTLIATSGTINPPPAMTVDSVLPLSGKPGDQIIITGTGFDNATVSLYVWPGPALNLQVSGTSTRLDAIVAIPPNFDVNLNPSGDIGLTIIGCSFSDAYPFHIDLVPITVSDVNPKVGNGTEKIRITGANFLSDPNIRVWVLDHASSGLAFERLMEIESTTDTEIVLYPLSDFSGEVDILIISYGRQIVSPQTILIQP